MKDLFEVPEPERTKAILALAESLDIFANTHEDLIEAEYRSGEPARFLAYVADNS